MPVRKPCTVLRRRDGLYGCPKAMYGVTIYACPNPYCGCHSQVKDVYGQSHSMLCKHFKMALYAGGDKVS